MIGVNWQFILNLKKKRLEQEIKNIFEDELLSFTKKSIVSVRADKAGLIVGKQSVTMRSMDSKGITGLEGILALVLISYVTWSKLWNRGQLLNFCIRSPAGWHSGWDSSGGYSLPVLRYPDLFVVTLCWTDGTCSLWHRLALASALHLPSLTLDSLIYKTGIHPSIPQLFIENLCMSDTVLGAEDEATNMQILLLLPHQVALEVT